MGSPSIDPSALQDPARASNRPPVAAMAVDPLQRVVRDMKELLTMIDSGQQTDLQEYMKRLVGGLGVGLDVIHAEMPRRLESQVIFEQKVQDDVVRR